MKAIMKNKIELFITILIVAIIITIITSIIIGPLLAALALNAKYLLFYIIIIGGVILFLKYDDIRSE